jgi:hypothetical protein
MNWRIYLSDSSFLHLPFFQRKSGGKTRGSAAAAIAIHMTIQQRREQAQLL